MPKKKLTKAQVKRKLIAMNNAMYDLFIDKVNYSDSLAKISIPKALEMMKTIKRINPELFRGPARKR